MTEIDLHATRDFAATLLADAGRLALHYFRQGIDVDNKLADGRFDPVTIADRDVETLLRERLHARFPDHGIVGEEHGTQAGGSRYSWIIDPIDGTRAFISGVPAWGILLGLRDGARCIAGWMHQPHIGETFSGSAAGAELDLRGERRALRTRQATRLGDAILYSTHPDLFAPGDEFAAFQRVAAAVRLMRYGGDCYSYCLLAAGCIDLVIESGLQAYDIQPLIPLIEAAGGVVSNRDGGDAHAGGFIVAAGNRELHGAALRLLAAG